MTATGRVAAGAGDSCGPLAAIRRQFPGWQVWRSDGDCLWATRIGAKLPARRPYWWAMTVAGDSPRELRDALADQEAHAVPG